MTTGVQQACGYPDGRTIVGGVFDIRAFQVSTAQRLLRWSIPSSLIGAVGLLMPWPLVQGIALQALLWGVIDSAIAAAGFVGVRRRLQLPPDEIVEVADTVRLRRMLVVNTWLDLLYVAVGAAVVALWYTDAFAVGNGIGVVVQALFLLAFDFLHARMMPRRAPAWYSPRR